MNNRKKLLAAAVQAHQAGDLAQAKKMYELILAQEPADAEVMHLLGMLAAQLGQFDVAVAWIEEALRIMPDNVLFHTNLGNALKNLGRWQDASQQYQQALQLDPQYAEAHNGLAGVYYKQNDLNAALQHYAQAVNLQPDYLAAHLNLGALFLRQGNFAAAYKQYGNVLQLYPDSAMAHYQLANLCLARDELNEAVQHYQVVLQQQPEHVEALNNLAVTLLKQNKISEASANFNKALTLDSQHKDARSNLAALLLQEEQWAEAIWHYQLLLRLDPQNIEAHYNLGVAYMASGNLQDAIQEFDLVLQAVTPHAVALQQKAALQQASNSAENLPANLQISQQYIDALCNLGAIFLKLEDRQQASSYYRRALQLQPENPGVRYLVTALSGETPPAAAPTEYIENLFDNYAGSFDQQLTQALHYRIPQLMYKALTDYLLATARDPQQYSKQWDILDLGCGTGLSGAPFRDVAKHMVGVDVAQRMLAKAREKNLYDELIAADIKTYLTENTVVYDLIIMADTAIYFGDLAPILAGCYQALKVGGLLIFSTELSDTTGYRLQMTGRYQHAQSYIEKLAQQQHFTLVISEQVVGRYQQDKPVASTLFILQRNE